MCQIGTSFFAEQLFSQLVGANVFRHFLTAAFKRTLTIQSSKDGSFDCRIAGGICNSKWSFIALGMMSRQLTDAMVDLIDADNYQISILNSLFQLAAGDFFFH